MIEIDLVVRVNTEVIFLSSSLLKLKKSTMIMMAYKHNRRKRMFSSLAT